MAVHIDAGSAHTVLKKIPSNHTPIAITVAALLLRLLLFFFRDMMSAVSQYCQVGSVIQWQGNISRHTYDNHNTVIPMGVIMVRIYIMRLNRSEPLFAFRKHQTYAIFDVSLASTLTCFATDGAALVFIRSTTFHRWEMWFRRLPCPCAVKSKHHKKFSFSLRVTTSIGTCRALPIWK